MRNCVALLNSTRSFGREVLLFILTCLWMTKFPLFKRKSGVDVDDLAGHGVVAGEKQEGVGDFVGGDPAFEVGLVEEHLELFGLHLVVVAGFDKSGCDGVDLDNGSYHFGKGFGKAVEAGFGGGIDD